MGLLRCYSNFEAPAVSPSIVEHYAVLTQALFVVCVADVD